jgi:hypothetical protein
MGNISCRYVQREVLWFFSLIMGNDIVAYRIAIGSFYLRTRSVVIKNILVSLKLSSYVLLVLLLVIHRLSLINCQSFINNYLFGCFYQNISFTLLLLQLLLLGNDVAENPGPETTVGEVSVFHWNSRSIRHKLDHLLITNLCYWKSFRWKYSDNRY